jgi:hypothetical protein
LTWDFKLAEAQGTELRAAPPQCGRHPGDLGVAAPAGGDRLQVSDEDP